MTPRARQRGAHTDGPTATEVSRAGVVAAAARRLNACRSMSELTELITECLLEVLGADRTALARVEQDQVRVVWVAPAADGATLARVTAEVVRADARPNVRRMIRDRVGWMVHVPAPGEEPEPGADPAELAQARAIGSSSQLCVPVVVNGTVWGCLIAGLARGRFTDDDLAVAEVMAALASAAVIRLDFENQVFHLLAEDPLTGLADRRVADGAAQHALVSGVQTCIVMCDVDGLKQVNDELGHGVGDELLRQVAGVLRRVAEALPGSVAARIGGDEFCLVVPGWPRHTVEEVLVRTMDEHPLPYGAAISWGLAASSIGEQVPASNLFRAADFAQYRVKRARARRRQLALPQAAEPALVAQQLLARAIPAIVSARGNELARICALAATATDTLGGGAWTVLRVAPDDGPLTVVARGGSPAGDGEADGSVVTVTDHVWQIEVGASAGVAVDELVLSALDAAMHVAGAPVR